MNRSRTTDRPLDFGLVAWLEKTRIALPLKGVECRFDVTGTVVSVELDQIYHQNAGRPLDCTYTFPLPAGAAVYRCEVHINGKVIRAKVESREDARQLYTEQKAAGRRAALVESERENLFTLSLGNVQPDDVLVVRFAWFQVLDRTGESLRLMVPTCPGIRYIPGRPLLRASSGRGVVEDTDQVPDASRISPPRIDALHVDAAYFSLIGRLSSSEVASGTITSPSHVVGIRESEGVLTVELADRGAVPDRDFVLTWREPEARHLTPSAWHWTEGDTTFALVQLRAPQSGAVSAGSCQDFYFLIDRSGSMSGAKWTRTCEALRAFVGLLGPDDRVWITLFESDCQDFAEVPMPAPQVLADRGFQRMEELGTGGGTELLPAARRVLEQIPRHSADRRATVILITDGEVGNDQEILRAFRGAPDVRVHTFGIDTTVNDAFLKALARQHRGGCWLQTPNDDIAGTIASLGGRLRRPVLTDLSVSSPWEAAGETWPDLHVQEVVHVVLKGAGTAPPEISGRTADGREHRLAVDLGPIGSEAIKLLWVRDRMAALLASDRQPEAILFAKKYTLICEGTAFIAWDETEQVSIAAEAIVQPSQAPARVLFSPVAAPQSAACFFPSFAPDPSSTFNEDHSPRRRSFFSRTVESAPVRLPIAETREALQRASIPETTIEEWLGWLQSEGSRAEARSTDLQNAAGLIEAMRSETTLRLYQERLEQALGHTIKLDPDAFLQWADETAPSFEALKAIQHSLRIAHTPDDVIDTLCAWTLDSGRFDCARVATLSTLADSLQHLPFSAAAKSHRWQAFVASTFQPTSREHTVITSWLSGTSVGDITLPNKRLAAPV